MDMPHGPGQKSGGWGHIRTMSPPSAQILFPGAGVLRRGAEQNETWFNSAALLLLSYAQMRLGQRTAEAGQTAGCVVPYGVAGHVLSDKHGIAKAKKPVVQGDRVSIGLPHLVHSGKGHDHR